MERTPSGDRGQLGLCNMEAAHLINTKPDLAKHFHLLTF